MIEDDYAEKVCGDCCYWHEGDLAPDLSKSGMCRRFPPTAVMFQTNQGMASGSAGLMLAPEQLACGEFDPGELVIVQ